MVAYTRLHSFRHSFIECIPPGDSTLFAKGRKTVHPSTASRFEVFPLFQETPGQLVAFRFLWFHFGQSWNTVYLSAGLTDETRAKARSHLGG